jgi:hypothetical protein
MRYLRVLSMMLPIILCSGKLKGYNNSKPQYSVYFQYTGLSYSESDVENPDNWVEIYILENLCNNINQLPCAIEVDWWSTQGYPPFRSLLPNVEIVAQQSMCGWYVTTAGDVVEAHNWGYVP